MKTKVIYEPKGKAREYCPLALNLYLGCTHECQYCYGPASMHKKREDYIASAQPRKDILTKLRSDLKKLEGTDVPVHLSFLGDCYQPAEEELFLTRDAINLFIEYNVPFQILTKGGQRAARDFDLLYEYRHRCKFGTTLIFTSELDAATWEPGAATVADRIDTIREAHGLGIKTWVSLEPVIDPDQALELVYQLHDIVDEWKVGKINYNKELEESVDWLKFRKDITHALDMAGATYYLKKSLTEL